MSIILFFVILAVLVLVHEFGHFIIAKKSGIRVDEFGLGFPPKLFGKKVGETEYTFNAIPFGGFVRIFGETPDADSITGPDRRRSLVNKPKYIQAAVMVGGVFFNILFAWLLFSVGFMTGLPTSVENVPVGANLQNVNVVVLGAELGSPADSIGLMPGDVILSLRSGEEELRDDVTIPSIQSFINTHGGEDVEITYRRGGISESQTLTPVEGIIEGRFAIGIGMDVIGTLALPPHRAIWEGGKMTVLFTGAIAVAFWDLVTSIFSGGTDLATISGPVGIIGVIGDAAEFGFVYLLSLTAIISINLAVINILPLPALDGGRLLFLAIEAIKRSPINPRVVNFIHTVGFVALLLLMVLVTWSDIAKLL